MRGRALRSAGGVFPRSTLTAGRPNEGTGGRRAGCYAAGYLVLLDLHFVLSGKCLRAIGTRLGIELRGPGLVDQVAGGVLDVAPTLTGGALELIFLASDFEVFVAYQGTGRLFDVAADFCITPLILSSFMGRLLGCRR